MVDVPILCPPSYLPLHPSALFNTVSTPYGHARRATVYTITEPLEISVFSACGEAIREAHTHMCARTHALNFLRSEIINANRAAADREADPGAKFYPNKGKPRRQTHEEGKR